MNKRLQVVLTEEAWNAVETLTKEATLNFDRGSIGYSDTINEMILTSNVDVKNLQRKHAVLRRTMRVLASAKDLTPEMAFEALSPFIEKQSRKSQKSSPQTKEVT